MAAVSVPARVARARGSTATRTTRGRVTLDRDVAPQWGRNRTGASRYGTKTVCGAMLPQKGKSALAT